MKTLLITLALVLVPLSVTVRAEVDTLFPNADTVSNWTYVGTSGNYTNIDEATYNDADYLYTFTATTIDLWKIDAPSFSQTSVVDSVVWHGRLCKNSAWHTVKIKRRFVMGGAVEEEAAEFTLSSTSYAEYNLKLANPDAGAWDSTDVANLRIGIQSTTNTDGGIGAPQARCSWAFALVYYTPGAAPTSSASQIIMVN